MKDDGELICKIIDILNPPQRIYERDGKTIHDGQRLLYELEGVRQDLAAGQVSAADVRTIERDQQSIIELEKLVGLTN